MNYVAEALATCAHVHSADCAQEFPSCNAPHLHLLHTHHARGPVRAFAKRAKSEAGWKYFDIDASHSPNVTAPDALVRLFKQCLH